MTVLDPEQLRRAVVRATLPRLAGYETLTTADIAHEAGVGEADLLAVFADKEAVMTACAAALTEAMTVLLDPAAEVRRIAAIPTGRPLASRLVQVIDIIDAYHRRIRVEVDDLLPDVDTSSTFPRGELRTFGNSQEFRDAVAKLLEPEEEGLRLPAPVLAEAFTGLIVGGVRPVGPDRSPLPAEQVVDLFLHGALNPGALNPGGRQVPGQSR